MARYFLPSVANCRGLCLRVNRIIWRRPFLPLGDRCFSPRSILLRAVVVGQFGTRVNSDLSRQVPCPSLSVIGQRRDRFTSVALQI